MLQMYYFQNEDLVFETPITISLSPSFPQGLGFANNGVFQDCKMWSVRGFPLTRHHFTNKILLYLQYPIAAVL